ncbi:NAD(P)/FAD-dependent oxidoreductase [Streptococcus cameli]
MEQHKIIIIGAGAAGIGFGSALRRFGIEDFLIIEKGEIGDSFLKWPKTTRFITPSFTTNGFGFPDINAVIPDTSPAFTFSKEHLSGQEYAEYLHLVAKTYDLPIRKNTTVLSIEKENQSYILNTDKGEFQATYLIMATGEFQNPWHADIEGAELAMHYGEIDSFHVSAKSDDPFLIIGGNESACDALTNLAYMGNPVQLYTSRFGKSETAPDPSISLSPITQERVEHITKKPNFKVSIEEGKKALRIQQVDGNYIVTFSDGTTATSSHKPILTTGFRSCAALIGGKELFEWQDGIPQVTEDDESTTADNVFLIGPSVRQKEVIFCYIYKFRQRFAPIIAHIAERENWELDPEELDFFKQNQMYLDDLSCCAVSCDC